MNNKVLIDIENLQPTQPDLTKKTQEFFKITFPLLRDIPAPEVWNINGEFLIADGHNQLYERYILHHKNKAYVRLHSEDNSSYTFIKDELIRKRDETKKRNVYSIKDMII